MTVEWHGAGAVPPARMRAANADRERTADVLRAGYAEGRLTKEEYDDRVEAALRAATYGELERLVADLPRGPTPPAMVPAPAPGVAVPVAFSGAPVVLPPPAPLAPINGTATAAMVCGIATPFTGGLASIPAVVLGHKARRDIRRTRERGDGRATAGLVIGYIFIALWIMGGLGALLGSGGDDGSDRDGGPVIVEQEGGAGQSSDDIGDDTDAVVPEPGPDAVAVPPDEEDDGAVREPSRRP